MARATTVDRTLPSTIAVRCRAVEEALTKGEMFGVPVPQKKLDANIKDIETRFTQAAALIGIKP